MIGISIGARVVIAIIFVTIMRSTIILIITSSHDMFIIDILANIMVIIRIVVIEIWDIYI